ncbi:MAG TPA: hypothetical protein VH817_15555 [Thermoleophilaceae bacterium]
MAVRGGTPDAAAAAVWHGTATGFQSRDKDVDQHTNPDIVFTSDETHQVTLHFSFEVGSGGDISGDGTGSYDFLTWHLQGTNGDHGSFSCDVPVDGNHFAVQAGGSVSGDDITLSLSIPGATESNDEKDCGADFSAFASVTHYIPQSLDAVGGTSISLSKSNPVKTLTKTEDSSTSTSTLHVENRWKITLTPPGGSNSGGGGGGGGGGSLPPSGNPPNPSACTIKGTSHADTLRGTSHADVICGFGGSDKIKGLGGNDKIYAGAGNDKINPGSGKDAVAAGPGRDKISAKDGKRDRINGGPGKDRAHVDKGLDKTSSVEHVT